MKNYKITECIAKYGASRYLKSLREHFLCKRYSREQFTFLAASVYLLIDKPKRALALLNSLDSPIISSEYNGKILELTVQLKNASTAPAGTCSLNMIVKNEQDCIGNALDSVDDIFDEIVLCDTGSIDATREIAELFGALVISSPWQNDFSYARNKAIAASSCAFIFWMDADDILESRSKPHLVNLWTTSHPLAAAVRVACKQDGTGVGEFMQVRLFPRKEGIHFERRVHEQVMFSLVRHAVGLVQCQWVRVVHTGYESLRQRQEKARRNKPLILTELMTSPEDPALLLNFGDCFMILEEWDEAHKVYLKIARNKALHEQHPDVFVQAVFNIGSILHIKKQHNAAIVWLMACLNLDPTRIEAMFLLGRSYETLRDFQKAFEHYVAAARTNPTIRQTATNTTKIKMQSIYHCAQILLASNHFREAEDLLTHAIGAYPTVVEYHTLLGQAAIKQNKIKEAAKAFMQSLSLSPEKNVDAYIGMALVYAQVHDLNKAREYLKKGNAL